MVQNFVQSRRFFYRSKRIKSVMRKASGVGGGYSIAAFYIYRYRYLYRFKYNPGLNVQEIHINPQFVSLNSRCQFEGFT